MGRGKKNFRADKEYDENQKLKAENQKLKKQISSLRKQLSRVDIDRYQNLKDLVIKQAKEDEEMAKVRAGKKLRDKWKCHECGEGYLRIILLPMLDKVKYIRKCSNFPTCRHQTKAKVYIKGQVKGIFEKEDKNEDKNTKS